MIKIKNIFFGFLISFLGSIPLGYLNIVGYEVFNKFGLTETVFYLLGVISIELFVIYFTLIFANKLIQNTKLLKFIEGFSVVFMFILAYVIYSSASNETTQQSYLEKYINYSPYVVGIILSCLNFIQIPFWISWNLFLLNKKYIEVTKTRKYFYVLGTLFGTFLGMLVLIISLDFITHQTNFFNKYLMKFIIPIGFVFVGFWQGATFCNKVFFHNK